jgi:hypothetical protein
MKMRLLVTSIISAFILGVTPNAFAADTKAPQLQTSSILRSKDLVDIRSESSEVKIRFTVTDESNLLIPRVNLVPADGKAASIPAEVIELKELRGYQEFVFEATVKVSSASSPGYWIWQIEVSDVVGNKFDGKWRFCVVDSCESTNDPQLLIGTQLDIALANCTLNPHQLFIKRLEALDQRFQRMKRLVLSTWDTAYERYPQVRNELELYLNGKLAPFKTRPSVWPTGGVQADSEPISLNGLSALYTPKNCEESFLNYGGDMEKRTTNVTLSPLGNSYSALFQVYFSPGDIPFLKDTVRREEFAKSVAERDLANKLAAATKKTTITCVKGKLTKKVTAVKPKCPAGYKVKK